MTESATATERLLAVYPSLWRRLAAMLYEALLVAALLMVATFVAGGATHKLAGWELFAFRLYLLGVLAVYFVWCWRRGGTLAMKAWKLRLVNRDGAKASFSQALLRFAYAAFALGLGVVGLMMMRQHAREWTTWALLSPGVVAIVWALFDADKQFLYDRLAGTRLVLLKKVESRASSVESS